MSKQELLDELRAQVADFDRIDADTPWSAQEPAWWLAWSAAARRARAAIESAEAQSESPDLLARVLDHIENGPGIEGESCPSCGRDNSAYGNVCTSDDCMGVQDRAAIAAATGKEESVSA